MKKTSMNKAALLGSASALGLNWIYDRDLLQEHKDSGNKMIFEAIDHDLYKQAKNGYDVYPNHSVGDLDFMGEVFYFTYMFLEYEEIQTLERYRYLFYEYFRPDYEYDGWIESYGKDLIATVKTEQEEHKEPQLETNYDDKQLIGLLFLLSVYEKDTMLNKEQEALRFAKVFTSYNEIDSIISAMYYLLVLLDQGVPFKEAAVQLEQYLPEGLKTKVLKALTNIDINTFIKDYSGVACGLDQALPLIFYILSHTSTWEEALVLNATLGGASSARGIFLSAIASRYLEIPKKYQDKLNYIVE
jgi:hypothetical protein